MPEAYSEPCQTFMMEPLPIISTLSRLLHYQLQNIEKHWIKGNSGSKWVWQNDRNIQAMVFWKVAILK